MRKRKKILVVEDNEKNRILMRYVLEYGGYTVLEAKDGAEGVDAARRERPDLIFMDVQMPVMDGVTALAMLRSDPETKDIKVVALTSFTMKGDRERIIAAGFDDYLSKPVNTRRLPELVRRLLFDETQHAKTA